MRLPLLFLFGRRDSTISYMGANIYPQEHDFGDRVPGEPLAVFRVGRPVAEPVRSARLPVR